MITVTLPRRESSWFSLCQREYLLEEAKQVDVRPRTEGREGKSFSDLVQRKQRLVTAKQFFFARLHSDSVVRRPWKSAQTSCHHQTTIGRNAATRVHSNPGSSTDQFDWEGRKINGNRKKTPRKCPFQGRNLKVTTPEVGRGKEKVETCSVAVPSEVGVLGCNRG